VTDAKGLFEQRSFGLAINGAESLGMTGGQTGGQYSFDYHFEFADTSGAKVTLGFHSYDQSKAFSVQPDMNKFTVTFSSSTVATQVHRNQYEG
jgi:hypothetical protein